MELFWSKGFEATSKRDLMEATGVASQSLYNAFGDKRSLFREAAAHYAEGIFAQLAAQLEETDSPLENLRRVIRSWAQTPKSCLLANTACEMGSTDPEIRDFLHLQMGRAVGMVQATLELAQAQGELAPNVDCSELAMALFAMRGGFSIMSRSEVSHEHLERAVAGAISLLSHCTT